MTDLTLTDTVRAALANVRLVVLHDRLADAWKRGDVVPVAALPDGTDLGRLFRLGAVRTAEPLHEAYRGHVDLPVVESSALATENHLRELGVLIHPSAVVPMPAPSGRPG
jgi:hypothetical protein